MPAPWHWSAIVGIVIGGGVVLVASLRYGFSFPLLVIGVVCAAVFGGLAFMGLFTSQRAEVD
jgi:hypothetical protein